MICINCHQPVKPEEYGNALWTHCKACWFETYFHPQTNLFTYRSDKDIFAGQWHIPPPGTLLIIKEDPI